MDAKLFAIALIALVLATLIRHWKSDFLPIFRIAVLLLFAIPALSSATPLISFLRELTSSTTASEHGATLLKALGIAVLVQWCSDVCRECGEGGIAGGVELIGKIEILLLALPLIREILSVAERLLSLGG